MQREKKEREEMQAQGLDPRASQMDLMEFMDKRIAAYEWTTVPDPKDLENILDRKNFWLWQRPEINVKIFVNARTSSVYVIR